MVGSRYRFSGSDFPPATTFLEDLAFLLQAGEHAIEVVLLDSHLRGQLGDGNARLLLDQRQRLCRALASALAPTCASPFGAGCLRARCFGRGSGTCACPGATRTPGPAATCRRPAGVPRGRRRRPSTNAVQRLSGGLKALVLVRQRLELGQPIGDLLALLVKKVGLGHGRVLACKGAARERIPYGGKRPSSPDGLCAGALAACTAWAPARSGDSALRRCAARHREL